jgi:predicted nucleotidyltransferase
MKRETVLDRLLGSKVKVKILRFLVLNPGEYSGRQIARDAGVNHWQANKALKDMYAERVIKIKPTRGAHFYSLDNEKYMVEKMIIPMFKSESDLSREMALNVKNLKNVKLSSLILFGSSARGEDEPRSDIDVAFIVNSQKDKKEAERQLDEKSSGFYERFGAIVSPYIMTEEELRNKFNNNDGLTMNIVNEGTVLYGRPPASVIAGVK